MGYQDTMDQMDSLVQRAQKAKKEQMEKEEKWGYLEPQEIQGKREKRETPVNWAHLEMRARQGRRAKKETKEMCPTMSCWQVPKVTKAHLDPLGPQALQALLDLLEAEDPKALGSQTCSMANVQVRHVPYQMMIPWREKLTRKSTNTIPHKQIP